MPNADELPESIESILGKKKQAWKIEDLAHLLDYDKSFIYKEVQRGRLQAHKVNSSIRLCPRAVVLWYRSNLTI
jgi:hypothetical protein